MKLEILTIGNELLLGSTVDTNGAEVARALGEVGVRVVRCTTVADDGDAIRHAVADALRRTGGVVTTGGLGPTRDDITKKVVADLFGRSLVLDERVLAELEDRFRRHGRAPMPQSNRSQAEVPEGATVLPNRWGTAPGLWIEDEGHLVVMLPGVPREMRGLLAESVIPRLAERTGTTVGVIRSIVLRTTGIAESALADRVAHLDDTVEPLTLAFLPSLLGVDLRFTAWHLPAPEADATLERCASRFEADLGEHCYGRGDADLAAVLIDLLRQRSWTLAVAESCTGGLVGQRVTAIPGASAVFAGGVIAYANDVKVRQLAVPEPILEAHGAVSEEAALAMARGVRDQFSTDAAIAVTGVAGPDGGTPDKPVGTVWMAALAGKEEIAKRRVFPGGRDEVRTRSAQASLDLLRRLLHAGR